MALTTDRMQEIMVDVDLGRDPVGYDDEERDFRERVERDIAEARARGESLGFTAELP